MLTIQQRLKEKTKIIWLASYPRSGNTYLRFLLSHYLFGDIKTSAEIEQKIPDVHHLTQAKKGILDTQKDRILMLKTHFPFSEQHPHIENSIGFIYILRNPRDVLLSSSRFIVGDDADKAQKIHFAKNFIQHMGAPIWRRAGMGAWPEHVASWLAAQTRIPGLFIKYEDLQYSPETELTKILTFFSVDTDRAKLQYAIEKSSIAAMRQLEQTEQIAVEEGAFHGSKSQFVGSGATNQSLRGLDEAIETQYRAQFDTFAHMFGY